MAVRWQYYGVMNDRAPNSGSASVLKRSPSGGRFLFKVAMGVGLGAVVLLVCPLAMAEEIRISRDDCASGVRVVARDAHLSEVLQRLAQALDFKLQYKSDSDPLISVDVASQPREIVTELAQGFNFSITQARNPRCPNQQRILKVAVLPNRLKNESSVMSTPAPRPPVQETPEQARQAQQALDAFLMTHGLEKQGEKRAPR